MRAAATHAPTSLLKKRTYIYGLQVVAFFAHRLRRMQTDKGGSIAASEGGQLRNTYFYFQNSPMMHEMCDLICQHYMKPFIRIRTTILYGAVLTLLAVWCMQLFNRQKRHCIDFTQLPLIGKCFYLPTAF